MIFKIALLVSVFTVAFGISAPYFRSKRHASYEGSDPYKFKQYVKMDVKAKKSEYHEPGPVPIKYHYGYDVSDHKHHDVHSQHESSDGHVTKGEYTLIEADGTKRIVKYSADKHGFVAKVTREGHPTPAPKKEASHYVAESKGSVKEYEESEGYGSSGYEVESEAESSYSGEGYGSESSYGGSESGSSSGGSESVSSYGGSESESRSGGSGYGEGEWKSAGYGYHVDGKYGYKKGHH